ncbi:MAG: hypothetical protein EPO32_01070 [Anaerolineae bacterium]|nr:MAG: hypothetical protein EPO32_01070 [Anaerolineae bacterium]
MLREETVRQNKGEPLRRWFADDYFDLILWEGDEDFLQMQLCYDRSGDEHALVWTEKKGYLHFRVDEGELGSLKKASPMMVDDGSFDGAKLRREFAARSRGLEPSVRRWVKRRLREFCGLRQE